MNNDIRLSEHFKLSEFTSSETARAAGIDNSPSEDIVSNLKGLVENILEPLRKEYGLPITVTSGYRCPSLNRKVGGVSNSSHQFGFAADIVPANGDFEGFVKFVTWFLERRSIMFGQCIIEKNGRGSRWLHISWKDYTSSQRCQVLNITVK